MVIILNWMMLIVLVWSEACIQQSIAQTSTLSQYEGDSVTLPCSLSGTFTFPEWRGPPTLTKYTNQDDASGAINGAAPAASRLQFANNDRDLILSNAVISDSGDYKCAYAGLGDHTITLTVNPATTTTPVIFKCPVLGSRSVAICVCFWIVISLVILLVVLFLTGIVFGCILLCVAATCCCICFYKGECCEDCANINCCKCGCCAPTLQSACCNIEGLPPWYQRLCASIIGSPVAFGIWVVLKCRNGNSDTAKNVVGTESSPKSAEALLDKSKSPGKAEDVNKEKHVSVKQNDDVNNEKHVSVKQNQHDQAHKLHLENEGKKPGRDLPPPPVGANPSSQSSNIQTTGHNNKSRSSSDDGHLLANMATPAKKKDALESIPDSTGEEVKKKKKKRKKSVKAEDDESV